MKSIMLLALILITLNACTPEEKENHLDSEIKELHE
jgi:hypothetical protein